VKLTTHLPLVPRSKDEWSYISTPRYVFTALCSAKSTGTTFTIIIIIIIIIILIIIIITLQVIVACFGLSFSCHPVAS
jgi:hypothetical protein